MDQLRSTMHRREAARLPHTEVVSRIGERRGTEWLLPEPYRPEKETRGRPSKAKGAEADLGSFCLAWSASVLFFSGRCSQ